MHCRTQRPAGILPEFVLNYHLREADLMEETRRVVFPARNDQLLEFYLGASSRVRLGESATIAAAPSAVLVGIQAVGRVELYLSGVIRTFTIVFQPLGFHRLFQVSMDEFAGKGLDAASVIGSSANVLYDRLLHAASFEEMVRCCNELLTPLAMLAEGRSDYFFKAMSRGISKPARQGSAHLEQLLSTSGLSQRQFERRFKQSVGVSPKRFTRVARLHRALHLKGLHTAWTWGQVAAECGYHDQMHLVHEFQDLGGDTPSTLIDLAGERDFGGRRI
jgi:AraC-like DNA-binding protein